MNKPPGYDSPELKHTGPYRLVFDPDTDPELRRQRRVNTAMYGLMVFNLGAAGFSLGNNAFHGWSAAAVTAMFLVLAANIAGVAVLAYRLGRSHGRTGA